MSDEPDPSRRRILQAAAGAGFAGVAGSAATVAYLTDRSSFPGNETGAGSLNLGLAADAAAGDDEADYVPSDDDFEDGSTVSVAFSSLEPGDSGVLTTAYRVCGAPGRVWFRVRTDGDDETALARHVDVRVAERPDCDGDGDALFAGTLDELIAAYEDGVQIGYDCVECEPACVDLEWTFDENPPPAVDDDSFTSELEFAAVQCRHNETPENPWN